MYEANKGDLVKVIPEHREVVDLVAIQQDISTKKDELVAWKALVASRQADVDNLENEIANLQAVLDTATGLGISLTPPVAIDPLPVEIIQ